MCKENIPYTFTSFPQTWNVDTSQMGYMDLCCWHYILTLPSTVCGSLEIKINQTRLCFYSFLLSSFGEPVPTEASVLSSWLRDVKPAVWLVCGYTARRQQAMIIIKSINFLSDQTAKHLLHMCINLGSLWPMAPLVLLWTTFDR